MVFFTATGTQESMRAVVIFVVLGVGSAVLFTARAAYRYYKSPIRAMPGPTIKSWLTGSQANVSDLATVELHEEWTRTFGLTFRDHGLLMMPVIFTSDTMALSHVLKNSNIYHKSAAVRDQLAELLGEGLLFVEGVTHKRQRQIMNPAFGPLQVKKFTETFVSKSNEMRDIWANLCSRSTRTDGRFRIDAFEWINKATLDIISITGFNYDPNALHTPEDQPSALNEAVRIMFSFNEVNVGNVLALFIPLLRKLPVKRVREIAQSNWVIKDFGRQLIEEKKAAVLAGLDSTKGGSLKKNDIEGSDLLTLLIKANMAADLSEEARLSDEQILAQVPTILVAGHETTSTAVAWTLFALACDRDVQKKLREELRDLPTDTPTDTELSSLTYLDHVMREGLRLYAPVYRTDRTANQDDVIPLSKPYIDIYGITHHEIRISKGDTIAIPIQILNRSPEVWGEDSSEFRPDRWANLPEKVKDVPAVFGHTLTFLAGSHGCIGYRFAIVEAKALLFAIVRNFEFELAVSPAEISHRSMIVARPVLDSNPGTGPQLPLLIRPVK